MTTEELITAQFYAWEKRGRGWQVWDHPVELEPPFEAFPGYYLPTNDDGRKATRLSTFLEKIHGTHTVPDPQIDVNALLEAYNKSGPPAFLDDSPPREMQIVLPTKSNITREVADRFLSTLRTAQMLLSFEVIGLADSITVQFVCRESDISLVRSNLRAYFHDVSFRDKDNFLIGAWSKFANAGCRPIIVDFGLSHEFIIPLPVTTGLPIDTLTGVVGSLAGLKADEMVVLQVLFQSTQHEWANNAIWATTDYAGNSVFANAPHMGEHLKHKIAHPLFAAVLRVGAIATDENRSWDLAKRLGAALMSVFVDSTRTDLNDLIPLSNDGYEEFSHEEDLLFRRSHRSGMILNAAELLSVVHIPMPTLRSEKFRTEGRITRAAPPVAVHARSRTVVTLGENVHEDETRTISLTDEQRSKHIHVLGATGSGKSTFLLSLIKQDLVNGNGLCVLDPHGDLIEDVIANVPETRLSDVILFDPSDADYPIGFNILQANSELEKTLLSSDLIATFRRMSTSWGDVMDSILANTILAFVESSRGGTLFDLKRFLVEKQFRTEFLQTVADDTVRYFWQNEFPLIGGKAHSSILMRLDTFLRQKLIRNIVCQKQTKLDFRKVMDGRKVLLIKLSQGLIGEENAYLLGTLLISRLYQTALSRQDSTVRPFFACYLDEFHHFVTPSMENVLSGSRKYNLGLALAHQEFRQLQSRSQDVANSVISNCYTRVCFRLGDNDAEKFAGGFSAFDSKSLQSLGTGEAVARVERSEYDFNLRTMQPESVSPVLADKRRVAIRERSRREYAVESLRVDPIPTAPPTAIDSIPRRQTPAEAPSNPAETTSDSIHERKGTGGQHHKELQAVVKRIGESYGFDVVVERYIPDGTGVIDVSLEKEGVKIACEVSVTSSTGYETKNILKCLSAGYDHVCVLVSNRKKIPSLKSSVRSDIPVGLHDKITVGGLTDLLGFLREFAPLTNPSKRAVRPAGSRLSFAEACEFFDVKPSTLYRWVKEGRVPYYRPGREYQFDREELKLIGRHDDSGKRKPKVDLPRLRIETPKSKGKKQQDDRYRKMLGFD